MTNRPRIHDNDERPADPNDIALMTNQPEFRRGELVWVDGTQVGVKFTSLDKKGRKTTAAS